MPRSKRTPASIRTARAVGGELSVHIWRSSVRSTSLTGLSSSRRPKTGRCCYPPLVPMLLNPCAQDHSRHPKRDGAARILEGKDFERDFRRSHGDLGFHKIVHCFVKDWTIRGFERKQGRSYPPCKLLSGRSLAWQSATFGTGESSVEDQWVRWAFHSFDVRICEIYGDARRDQIGESMSLDCLQNGSTMTL